MMTNPPVDPSQLRRLAIMMPNWLGDAVMAEPSIRAIHLAAPSLELSLFGKKSAVSMLEGHPAISSIAGIDDKGLFGPLACGQALRAADADAVLLLRGSFRSGLGGVISRIRPRIGFARDGRRVMLTHPIRPPARTKPCPTVDFYATLVESAFGITVGDRLPRLTTTPNEREAASQLLDGVSGPSVGFGPGGSKLMKRWPADRFAERFPLERKSMAAVVGIALGVEVDWLNDGEHISELFDQCGHHVIGDVLVIANARGVGNFDLETASFVGRRRVSDGQHGGVGQLRQHGVVGVVVADLVDTVFHLATSEQKTSGEIAIGARILPGFGGPSGHLDTDATSELRLQNVGTPRKEQHQRANRQRRAQEQERASKRDPIDLRFERPMDRGEHGRKHRDRLQSEHFGADRKEHPADEE